MNLIVGLGNPGKKYAGTRHNLGFQVIEALSHRLNSGKPVQKYHSLYVLTRHENVEVALAQPLTYMNLSGKAVIELVANLHIELPDLMIVCDDLDLPPGAIRLRKKGGSSGHRGLQSIIDALGTTEFCRLRIGIGKPSGEIDSSEYVLEPPEDYDKILLGDAIDRAAEAVLCYIEDDIEKAMNIYNKGLPETE
ncbi:MAG: aminoacyl-tRNA hydrolase [Bacillota bacterium]|nr:aminoacyl-tRNA hydrolase [Bacillota bacterium]